MSIRQLPEKRLSLDVSVLFLMCVLTLVGLALVSGGVYAVAGVLSGLALSQVFR